MQLKLVYLPSENTAFPVKLRQLSKMSLLREGSRDEGITEIYTLTVVKFHDSPICSCPVALNINKVKT